MTLASIANPSFEFSGGKQAVLVGTQSEPFALADGYTLEVEVNGGEPQLFTFSAADFADIANATAAEVVAVLEASTLGIYATDVGGLIVLSTYREGTSASIHALSSLAGDALFLPSEKVIGYDVKGEASAWDITSFSNAEMLAEFVVVPDAPAGELQTRPWESFETGWGQVLTPTDFEDAVFLGPVGDQDRADFDFQWGRRPIVVETRFRQPYDLATTQDLTISTREAPLQEFRFDKGFVNTGPNVTAQQVLNEILGGNPQGFSVELTSDGAGLRFEVPYEPASANPQDPFLEIHGPLDAELLELGLVAGRFVINRANGENNLGPLIQAVFNEGTTPTFYDSFRAGWTSNNLGDVLGPVEDATFIPGNLSFENFRRSWTGNFPIVVGIPSPSSYEDAEFGASNAIIENFAVPNPVLGVVTINQAVAGAVYEIVFDNQPFAYRAQAGDGTQDIALGLASVVLNSGEFLDFTAGAILSQFLVGVLSSRQWPEPEFLPNIFVRSTAAGSISFQEPTGRDEWPLRSMLFPF